MIEIPALVRNKANALGERAWLESLPDLVREVEVEWSLSIGRVFGDATEAVVAEATLEDGAPAVVKIPVHSSANPGAIAHEVTALRLADGHGCVRLLRADEERGVLLLERLGRSLHDFALPIDRRHEVLCGAIEQMWRPAPGCGLPTGAEKALSLAESIPLVWADTGRPCSLRAVDHARTCAATRAAAHDEERAVLVHGDLHEWNALAAPSGGFKLVDPDGLLAEAEYDLGVLMREDPVELLEGGSHARAQRLAARTGLDATAIWEWGVIERVSTGLLAERIGLQPVGRHMLAVADRLAEDGRSVSMRGARADRG